MSITMIRLLMVRLFNDELEVRFRILTVHFNNTAFSFVARFNGLTSGERARMKGGLYQMQPNHWIELSNDAVIEHRRIMAQLLGLTCIALQSSNPSKPISGSR